MKIVLHAGTKGGPGSGFHGHAGRAGKIGGSASVGAAPKAKVHIYDVSKSIIDYIVSDESVARIAAALAADGSDEEVENVGQAIADVIPGFNALCIASSEGVRLPGTREKKAIPSDVANAVQRFLDKVGTLYEQARLESGWMDWKGITSAARDEWEKRWYGKVVGGSSEGEQFGIDYMHKLAANILAGRKVVLPKIIKDYASDYE